MKAPRILVYASGSLLLFVWLALATWEKPVIRDLKSEDTAKRSRAVRILAQEGSRDDRPAIPILIEYLESAHDNPRRLHTESALQALARIELDRISEAVTLGQIPRSRWDELVAHRVRRERCDTEVAGRTRVAVHRTATRLAHLVDHAA